MCGKTYDTGGFSDALRQNRFLKAMAIKILRIKVLYMQTMRGDQVVLGPTV